MSGRTLTTITLVALCIANFAMPVAAHGPGVSVDLREAVRDSYIFVFDDSVGAHDVAAAARAMVGPNSGRVTHTYTTALRGFTAKVPAAAAARIAATSQIAYFEADQIAYAFPPPPWAGGPGGGGDDGEDASACESQVTPWGIARVGHPQDGTGKTAWVIDTGIDLDHPDLAVDVDRSRNFASRGKDSANDGNGHGTHVAGTIAALDNGCDVVGAAAGATVVAVRVLDNRGSGSYADVIAGVDYVAANGDSGDVANMSLGGPYSQALNDAVTAAADAGIKFALAAGNSSTHAGTTSPASANGTNIYTISAFGQGDVFASFSNYGNPPVDCSAPGVDVLSLAPGGGTSSASGTSMAAPHVAGLLLFGAPGTDRTVNGDPDGDPDPICHN